MAKRKRSAVAGGPAAEQNALLPQVRAPAAFPRAACSVARLLQKRHYRQRAHANPFSDHALSYPASPRALNWAELYPAFANSGKTPEFADVGCGFGGLLIALAPLYPDTLMLGQSSRPSIADL